KDINRHFSNEDKQTASRHVKRCSASLIIREIHIQAPVRHHLTPVRVAKINNTGNNRCRRGCGEKGTLLHCWWECELAQPLWKTVWRLLIKFKIELPYAPATTHLDRHLLTLCLYLSLRNKKSLKKIKSLIHFKLLCAHGIRRRSNFRPKCPLTDEWIKNMWYIYIHMYTYIHTYTYTNIQKNESIKKNEILPFETMWMELECIMLSEISQPGKDKYHVISLPFGI
ncbi:LORF2 protein, partial [Crocuta crocuta]